MAGAGEGAGKARGLLAAGDVPGLVRYLRADGGSLPPGEVAGLVAGLARLIGCGGLGRAAALAAERRDGCTTEDALVLYSFGYACLD